MCSPPRRGSGSARTAVSRVSLCSIKQQMSSESLLSDRKFLLSPKQLEGAGLSPPAPRRLLPALTNGCKHHSALKQHLSIRTDIKCWVYVAVSAPEVNDGALTTQHTDVNHGFVRGEKGSKRMRKQNCRSDEMKERRETTEGEERDDFSWRGGSLPRLPSAEQRAGNRESGEDQGGKRRGEKRGKNKNKGIKGAEGGWRRRREER